MSAKGIMQIVVKIPTNTININCITLVYSELKIKYLDPEIIITHIKRGFILSFQYQFTTSPFKSLLCIKLGVIKKYKVFIVAQDMAPPMAPYFKAKKMVKGIIITIKNMF